MVPCCIVYIYLHKILYYIFIVLCRIKQCVKEIKKKKTNTDTAVLHNYVEMKEEVKKELTVTTVSYA